MPAFAEVTPSVVYRRIMERLPIRTSARRIQRMQFNWTQEQLWKTIAPYLDRREPIKMIILKARREGVSTFTEALLTTECLLHNYTRAMVVAHQHEPTRRIWDMARRMATSQESPLAAVARVSGHTISFRESMLELATAGSPEAARSSDLTALHNSELAFWKDPAALLALRQCLPQAEGEFFITVDESTANSMVEEGETFYNEWQAAVNGESGYLAEFLSWQAFPAYTLVNQMPLDDLDSEEEDLLRDFKLTWGQLRWRRRTIADRCQGDVNKFNQEYPSTPEMAFIMTGHPLFRASDLMWLEPLLAQGKRGRLVERGGRVQMRLDGTGPFQVWKSPEPGHQYVIGADSAMGIDDDDHSKSAAEVLDMATLEQVAEYVAPAPPHIFAHDLALLGRAYNTALLFPEVQGSGGGGGRELVVYLRDQYRYPYIGRWRGANDRVSPNNPILYGWETNARTKPMMLARMQEVLWERSVILHSRALITQLRCYGQKDSGAVEALAGHDDLVMAWGIALMGRFQNYRSAPVVAPTMPELTLFKRTVQTQPSITEAERKVWEEIRRGVTPMPQQEFLAW